MASSPVDTRAYLVSSPTSAVEPGIIKRRAVQPDDVSITIHYCGICHSDLHMAHNDWGMASYPIALGHEIVGIVDAVGSEVTQFKVGQRAAVGCIVDSCDSCHFCSSDLEPHCKEATWTYAGVDKVGNLGITHGGYSERIVISERYVLHLPDNLDMAAAAPLLCAGITVWTPLQNAKIGPGKSVGVLGVGGLGHMALQLARALGAHVVALTRVAAKKDELLALGAHQVLVTSDADALKAAVDTLDLVIDTVSAEHEVNSIIALLKFGGIRFSTLHLPLPSPLQENQHHWHEYRRNSQYPRDA